MHLLTPVKTLKPNLRLFFLIISSNNKYRYAGDGDQRRADINNTWGVRAREHPEMDYAFMIGDSPVDCYNHHTRELHLKEDDSYDMPTVLNGKEGTWSPMFDKTIRSISILDSSLKLPEGAPKLEWVVVIDDDTWINTDNILDNLPDPEQGIFHMRGNYGGSGHWIRGDKLKWVAGLKNWDNICSHDWAFYQLLIGDRRQDAEDKHGHQEHIDQDPSVLASTSPYWISGDKYSLIHYVTRDRMYHLERIRELQKTEKGPQRRLSFFDAGAGGHEWMGAPLKMEQSVIEGETDDSRIYTRANHALVMDDKGWEFIGDIWGMHSQQIFWSMFWPFSEKSADMIVLNANIDMWGDTNVSLELNWELGCPKIPEDILDWWIKALDKTVAEQEMLFLSTSAKDRIVLPGWTPDPRLNDLLGYNWRHRKDRILYRRCTWDRVVELYSQKNEMYQSNRTYHVV